MKKAQNIAKNIISFSEKFSSYFVRRKICHLVTNKMENCNSTPKTCACAIERLIGAHQVI